jgi:hypothetical protein
MTVGELIDRLRGLGEERRDWVVEVVDHHLDWAGYPAAIAREADGIEAVGCYVVID